MKWGNGSSVWGVPSISNIILFSHGRSGGIRIPSRDSCPSMPRRYLVFHYSLEDSPGLITKRNPLYAYWIFLFSKEWEDNFTGVLQQALLRAVSDHFLLLLDTSLVMEPQSFKS